MLKESVDENYAHSVGCNEFKRDLLLHIQYVEGSGCVQI